MTKAELIATLAPFKDDAKVLILTHKDMDDYQAFEIDAVHDGFILKEQGDMISIEIDIANMK